MKKYSESIFCCNSILKDYPNNTEILFDKSCNLAMLSIFDESLDLLENIISKEKNTK